MVSIFPGTWRHFETTVPNLIEILIKIAVNLQNPNPGGEGGVRTYLTLHFKCLFLDLYIYIFPKRWNVNLIEIGVWGGGVQAPTQLMRLVCVFKSNFYISYNKTEMLFTLSSHPSLWIFKGMTQRKLINYIPDYF